MFDLQCRKGCLLNCLLPKEFLRKASSDLSFQSDRAIDMLGDFYILPLSFVESRWSLYWLLNDSNFLLFYDLIFFRLM